MADRIINDSKLGDEFRIRIIKPGYTGGFRLRKTDVAEGTKIIINPYVAPEPEPEPEPEPQPQPTGVLWLSKAEIMALPNNNTAFNAMKTRAAAAQPSLSYTSYSEKHSKWVMDNALVAVRNNDAAAKARAISGLQKATTTAHTTESFKEVTRNWPEYIISANLLDYRDSAFVAKLRALIGTRFTGSDSGTIMSNNENSPGNGSACAGAMLAAAGIYLNEQTWIASAIEGIKMFTGSRPGDFDIRQDGRDLWYYPVGQIAKYTPINPAGSSIVIEGAARDVSGFIPVEIERSNPEYHWPPLKDGPNGSSENYFRLNLGSRTLQAWILKKAGLFDAFPLGNKALLRAGQAEVFTLNWEGPTYFHRRLLELAYGVDLGATIPKDGRCVTGVDWSHP